VARKGQLKPKACNDYSRTPTGKWLYQGEDVSKEVAERLNNLAIPPAWTQVVVAKNPLAKMIAIGKDSADRWVYRFAKKFMAANQVKNFDRIKSFARDIGAIRRKIVQDINAGNPLAFLLRLEDRTVIRAGSLADTKAKVQAYGLTTLLNRHVVVRGNKIIMDFIAKKGIPAHYEITDKVLAPWIAARKAATKAGEMLFKDMPARKLNNYIRALSGKEYTIKDFRTLHATRMARDLLKEYNGVALTEIERKAIVKEVSTKVSEFLHNSPIMARNSYIDPTVWEMIGGLPGKIKKVAQKAEGLIPKVVPEYKVKDAFSMYKGSDPDVNAIGLNWSLRSGELLNSKQKSIVMKMDEAFMHASKSNGEIVYRGFGGKLPEGLEVGKLFYDDAFVSTSRSFKVAENFSTLVEDTGYVFKINIPRGARRIEMDQFADAFDIGTTIGKEKEVLLPRGAIFDIKSIRGNIVEMDYVGNGSGWSLGRNKAISLNRFIKEDGRQ